MCCPVRRCVLCTVSAEDRGKGIFDSLISAMVTKRNCVGRKGINGQFGRNAEKEGRIGGAWIWTEARLLSDTPAGM